MQPTLIICLNWVIASDVKIYGTVVARRLHCFRLCFKIIAQSSLRTPWWVTFIWGIARPVFMDFTATQKPLSADNPLDGHVDSWPRILIMSPSGEGNVLSTMSPFAIQKGVTGIAGDGVAIKRSQNGILTLTCGKKSQSDNLLKCVSLGGLAPVTVSPHRSLNTCKGVIRNWELANCDPEEVKRNIPNIVDIHRIVSKRDGKEIKTNTLILTFNLPKIPSSLKICYLNVPVTEYVPNPMRCYKCQTFGHMSNKCKKSEICARCSETGHYDKTCNKAFKCINCKENHAAYSKKCPIYKKEYDIQNIRVKKNVSFFEARKQYNQSHGQKDLHFANAVKKPSHVTTVSVSTQSDMYMYWNGSELVTRKDPLLNSTKSKAAVTQTVKTATTHAAASSSTATTVSKPASKPGSTVNAVKQAQAEIRSQLAKHNPPKTDKREKTKTDTSVQNSAKQKQKTTSLKGNQLNEKTITKQSPDKTKDSSRQQLKIKKTTPTVNLKRTYKASDFLGSTSTESSPARPTAKTKMKKVDKEISFSDMAAKTRPMALDFFDDNDYHALCEDVETLTSGLKTVKEKDREYLKKGMIRLP